MDARLTRSIWVRAGDCCEYCRTPQQFDDASFEIDHVIARKHGGLTVRSNLALSCFSCNSHKGSDIAGLDGSIHKLTRLFNPRRNKWSKHFRWEGPVLLGQTAIGRVTVALLQINDEYRVELRRGLIAEGVFPPG